MFKESPAPMSTYERGVEPVFLGREEGRDDGKDIQRDAVDGREGVLPPAYG